MHIRTAINIKTKDMRRVTPPTAASDQHAFTNICLSVSVQLWPKKILKVSVTEFPFQEQVNSCPFLIQVSCDISGHFAVSG